MTRHLILAFCLLGLVACDKTQVRMKNPEAFSAFAAQSPYTLTSVRWRLVATTDPAFHQTLSTTTFPYLTLNADYTGSVHSVVGGVDKGVTETLSYANDPVNKVLMAKYANPNGSPAGYADFTYTLSTQLTFTEMTSGYTYRYAPYP